MKTKIDLYSVFLHLCLVALAVLVFYLVQENRRLSAEIQAIITPIKQGDTIKDLVISTSQGTDSTISFSQQPQKTVLFIFSTNCPHCKKVSPLISKLYQNNRNKFTFIGVSTDSAEAMHKFAATYGLQLPLYHSKLAAFKKSIPTVAVPLTIFMQNGRVLAFWPGDFGESGYQDIQSELERN